MLAGIWNRIRLCSVMFPSCFLAHSGSVGKVLAPLVHFFNFLFRLGKDGLALLPSDGEHFELSAHRHYDPFRPASGRAEVPAVRIRVLFASFFF